MSKKRSKTPSTSRITARKTEAPKLLTRDAVVEVVAPVALVEVAPVAEVVAEVEAAPVAEVEVKAAPARKQIARLAYAKFVARGYVHGYHVQDWLAAEAELVVHG